ncbi:hypothetical protein ACEPPN_007474 [Leptodophora sp. 'Broadleaf-Isolate-01']
MTDAHLITSAILSRDTGARILEIVAQATTENPVPIRLRLAFANDDLFCEWAYVADLDHGVYEVYGGVQLKDKAVNKRFNDIGNELDTVPAFVKGFSFNKVPATEMEFISKILGEDWVEGAREEEEDDGEEFEEEDEGRGEDGVERER